jgi:hypothetical protein
VLQVLICAYQCIMGSMNIVYKLLLPLDVLHLSSADVEEGCARMECHFLQAKLKLELS